MNAALAALGIYMLGSVSTLAQSDIIQTLLLTNAENVMLVPQQVLSVAALVTPRVQVIASHALRELFSTQTLMVNVSIHVRVVIGVTFLLGLANLAIIQVAVPPEKHVLPVLEVSEPVVSLAQQTHTISVVIIHASPLVLMGSIQMVSQIPTISVSHAIKIILPAILMGHVSLVVDLTQISANLVAVSNIWIPQPENV